MQLLAGARGQPTHRSLPASSTDIREVRPSSEKGTLLAIKRLSASSVPASQFVTRSASSRALAAMGTASLCSNRILSGDATTLFLSRKNALEYLACRPLGKLRQKFNPRRQFVLHEARGGKIR